MSFIARNGSGGNDFTPAPEDTHEAVIVDVVDKGIKEMSFEPGKTKNVQYVGIVWEIDAHLDNGRRYTVTKRYPLSLAEWKSPQGIKRSKLREDVVKILGRDITPEEDRRGFDVESLIGYQNRIVVEHSTGADGRVWANVGSILKTKHPLAPSGEYTRQVDRDRAKLNPAPSNGWTGRPNAAPIGRTDLGKGANPAEIDDDSPEVKF